VLTNLVFVVFAHLHVLVKSCSFFVSASHVFTISGSLRSAILETYVKVWIRACIVS
jgi:hypothetical protein